MLYTFRAYFSLHTRNTYKMLMLNSVKKKFLCRYLESLSRHKQADYIIIIIKKWSAFGDFAFTK